MANLLACRKCSIVVVKINNHMPRKMGIMYQLFFCDLDHEPPAYVFMYDSSLEKYKALSFTKAPERKPHAVPTVMDGRGRCVCKVFLMTPGFCLYLIFNQICGPPHDPPLWTPLLLGVSAGRCSPPARCEVLGKGRRGIGRRGQEMDKGRGARWRNVALCWKQRNWHSLPGCALRQP